MNKVVVGQVDLTTEPCYWTLEKIRAEGWPDLMSWWLDRFWNEELWQIHLEEGHRLYPNQSFVLWIENIGAIGGFVHEDTR